MVSLTNPYRNYKRTDLVYGRIKGHSNVVL